MERNRGNVEQHLRQIESELLQLGSTSWISWMGIAVQWQFGPKRNGNNLKRGKAYGTIKYFENTLRKELTRLEAIDRILMPMALREAEYALHDIRVCSICSKVAIGMRWEEKRQWKFISRWGKTDIALCDSCLEAIAKGEIIKTA